MLKLSPKHLTYQERDSRWIQIQNLYREGYTEEQIGDKFNLSKQRISQLIQSSRPTPRASGRTVVDGVSINDSAEGWIYLVESAGLWKVGFTKDWDKRIKYLRANSASPIKFHSKRRGTCRQEKWVQYQLLKYRHHNEWVKADAFDEIIRLFKTMNTETRVLTPQEYTKLQNICWPRRGYKR